MKFNIRKYPVGSVINFSYPCGDEKTDCYPYEAVFPAGIYKFDVWGAEGGKAFNMSGGFGGYSTGKLVLFAPTKVFLFVGAQGPSTSNESGSVSKTAFNGGGSGRQSHDKNYMSSSGGGSSDIRLYNNDIYHRLIVAAGGGGSGNYDAYLKGGDGGGESGESGIKANKPTGYAGIGANQISGNLLNGSSITDTDGCGGGGGLFGGNNGYGYNNPGGGGSGFVFNASNTAISSAANIILPTENFLFESFTSRSQHLGDGFINVTIIRISRRVMKGKCSCRNPRAIYVLIFIIFS